MVDLYAEEIDDVWFGVAYDRQTVFATYFASDEKKALQGLRESLPPNVSCQQTEKASTFARSVIIAMKDIYDGKDVSPSFALATGHLPGYSRKVIETTYRIPTGYVASYGSIAKAVGGGPRAVGNIMAKNPYAPLVPCHRVVGSDFTLVGYGGGLDLKLQFLKRESRGFTSNKEIAIDNGKLVVFPVERLLKKARKASLEFLQRVHASERGLFEAFSVRRLRARVRCVFSEKCLAEFRACHILSFRWSCCLRMMVSSLCIAPTFLAGVL
jgi:O-6-methylguanine DNA methyltransferase